MKTKEEILKQVEEAIETRFVTATFGDNWKEYIKTQFEKEECDIDSIINIAWKQGRRALLLERALSQLTNTVNESDSYAIATFLVDKSKLGAGKRDIITYNQAIKEAIVFINNK